jgi:CDP-diacylglycerol--glycerol-3-phosphate 3-phosphatidyltransferase
MMRPSGSGHAGRYARAATALTVSRFVLAVPLALLTDRRAALVLLLAAGATDALDGPCARRGGVAGPAGARLDSAADVVFLAAVLVLLGRLLGDAMLPFLPWVVAVAVVRVAALVIGRVRLGRWASVHTWANKAAGAGVVGAPLLVLVGWPAGLWAVLALAAVSAFEELALQATSRTFDPDRAGLIAGTRRRRSGRVAPDREEDGNRASHPTRDRPEDGDRARQAPRDRPEDRDRA